MDIPTEHYVDNDSSSTRLHVIVSVSHLSEIIFFFNATIPIFLLYSIIIPWISNIVNYIPLSLSWTTKTTGNIIINTVYWYDNGI